MVGGDDAGIDQRPDQRDGAGRIAAGIGDALGARALASACVGVELGEAVDPAGRDAMRGRGIEDARRLVAERIGERHRFLGGIVGQAQHDEVDVAPASPCARRRSLRSAGSMLFTSTRGSRASRSRISSPVVPASPSMKIFGLCDVLIASALVAAPQLRLRGSKSPHTMLSI